MENGEVKGLKAKGGFEVSIKWSEGKLQSAEIKSLCGMQCRLRANTVVSISCDGKMLILSLLIILFYLIPKRQDLHYKELRKQS